MGFLGFLFGNRDAMPPSYPLTIDLATFSCGRSQIGEAIADGEYYTKALRKKGTLEDKQNGVVLGAKQSVFDWVYIELKNFTGDFAKSGSRIELNTRTTQAQILEWFGEPYWIDRDGEEVILFYEYRNGTVELQFEFTHGHTLDIITLCQNGVLSDAEQRSRYKVTKPWPPV